MNNKLSKIGIVIISLSVLLTMAIILFPDLPIFSTLVGIGVVTQKISDYLYIGLSIFGIILGIIMIALDNTPKARKEQEELRKLYKDYTIEIEGEKNNVEDPKLKKEIIENIEIKNKKKFRVDTIPMFDHINYELVAFDKKNKRIKLRYFSDN